MRAASVTTVTDAEAQGLAGPPVAGDETATLLGSLERQRATFAWKVGGLDASGLAAKVGAAGIAQMQVDHAEFQRKFVAQYAPPAPPPAPAKK